MATRAGGIRAAILDMDGVVTDTARLHARAWQVTFDAYLAERSRRLGESHRPFDPEDYLAHLDGRPRYEGAARFLAARGIELPFGSPRDAPERETACGLGNRKERAFEELLRSEGVRVLAPTASFIRHLEQAGVPLAVVTSSRHGEEILLRTGLRPLFAARLDGTAAAALGLEGKPRADVFLEAARRLEVEPARSVVVEDAVAGVEAGRRGGFGVVVGLDRGGNRDALAAAGADLVVESLDALDLAALDRALESRCRRPPALSRLDEIRRRLAGKRPAVFLDYDGTLAPIAPRPELAVLPPATREALERLARLAPVAVVSGRGLEEARRLVGMDTLVYAGNHGLEIQAPGRGLEHQAGREFLPRVAEARERIAAALRGIGGAWVEDKTHSLSVHFRQVEDARVAEVEAAVDEAVRAVGGLRKHHGKRVFEVRPRLDWDKGRAVTWLLQALQLDGPDVVPLYLGDDVTDEDAFRALGPSAIRVRVGPPAPTAADYSLADPAEVREFLLALASGLEPSP